MIETFEYLGNTISMDMLDNRGALDECARNLIEVPLDKVPEGQRGWAKVCNWLVKRQKCRTDLFYLCGEILGYDIIDRQIHAPIVDSLQKFHGCWDIVDRKSFKLLETKPKRPMWKLEGGRKTLILVTRGGLKTCIAVVGHSIQWIINYPNVRIVFSSGTGDQIKEMITITKEHFTKNERFRYLFPEFCPSARKAADWGNTEEFTVPNRTSVGIRGATISGLTIGTSLAGYRGDVFKNDDLVDKETIKTKDSIAIVNSHFGHLWPLVENSPINPNEIGWVDVIGTRYHHLDLYGVISDGEKEKTDKDKQWKTVFLPAYTIVNGEKKAWWPQRIPVKKIEDLIADPSCGLATVNAQYLLNPVPDEKSLCDIKDLVWIPRQELDNLMPRLRQRATFDLAGFENAKSGSDYTAINHSGFGGDGRLYINLLRIKHFTQKEVIDAVFEIYAKYPQTIEFRFSKDLLTLGFLPTLMKECAIRQKFPQIVAVPVDNQRSKTTKIGALQPWFANKNIRLAADLEARHHITNEIAYFPKYHDDGLDTIVDQIQGLDGEINWDVVPTTDKQWSKPEHKVFPWILDEQTLYHKQEEVTYADPMTGL